MLGCGIAIPLDNRAYRLEVYAPFFGFGELKSLEKCCGDGKNDYFCIGLFIYFEDEAYFLLIDCDCECGVGECEAEATERNSYTKGHCRSLFGISGRNVLPYDDGCFAFGYD